MGGSSKGGSTQTQVIPARTEVTPVQRNVSVVVGYKYYFGAHMALTHGPVDFVSRIKVGDKCAWSGISEGGRINISASNLFGGVDGEGGVSGPVDFLQGYNTQAVNDYLAARLGGADGTPAFRGVTSMVLRQVYVSANNPYLKPWAFTMSRTNVTTYGEEIWNSSKSTIGANIYPFLDENGFIIYGELPSATITDPTVTDNNSQPITVNQSGDWKYISSGGDDGIVVTPSVTMQVDILMVGGGGESRSSAIGGGAGAGQVRIFPYTLTAGQTYFFEIGQDTTSLSVGGNPTRMRLNNLTGTILETALGGWNTAPGYEDYDGTEGGMSYWGGSGATNSQYNETCFATDSEGTSCAPVIDNTVFAGGIGKGFNGGSTGKNKAEKFASAGIPSGWGCSVSLGGQGGGAGACGPGGSGSGAVSAWPNPDHVPGAGGRGGPGLDLNFCGIGNPGRVGYGGRGTGGVGRCGTTTKFGTTGETWRAGRTHEWGFGGDAVASSSGVGSRGLVMIRWRVQ